MAEYKICECCKKEFYIGGFVDYIYKHNEKWYCSYTCYRKGIEDKRVVVNK